MGTRLGYSTYTVGIHFGYSGNTVGIQYLHSCDTFWIKLGYSGDIVHTTQFGYIFDIVAIQWV